MCMRIGFGMIFLAVVAAVSPAARAGNLIVNGGFESPVITPPFQTLFAPDNTMPGWTVYSGSVDLTNTSNLPSYEGVQDLDLDGHSPGAISQSFATTAGAQYTLSFFYANNWAGPTGLSTANVSVVGIGTLLGQDITHSGSTIANMNYQEFVGTFTADSSMATLKFVSTDPSGDAYGIVLDAVSVSAVPEPSALVLGGTGAVVMLALAGFRARRSLVPSR
jgi:choice-of-anchor C domain-containing protein